VSSSPYRLSAWSAAPLSESETSRQVPSPWPSSAVIGSDGTEVIKVCRYTEPAGTRTSDQPRVVVGVSGDIDADTAPVLHAALIDAISRHRRVCCDLTGVEFFGAAGANTIVAALRHADRADCAFAVRGVHGLAVQVFQISGLGALLSAPGAHAVVPH
jgi:anti-anti-sigma factor